MNKEKYLKKERILFETLHTIILIIFIFLCIIAEKNNLKNKSDAYKNKVMPYANEQITDLTGTSWLFNDSVTSFGSEDTINITFISGGQEFNSIYFTENFDDENMIMKTTMYFNNTIVSNTSTISNVTIFENYRNITILGGSDATNTRFVINWLYNNATIIEEEEEIYNISYNLQNVLIIGEKPTKISNQEEISIEFQNFNNYELPQNIMVDGASYNWNNETGILTIYNAKGNVTITVRAEYISGNYSFIELIDSVVLIPLNAFFNLFNFEIFGVNIYALLTATLTLFVIIKILLKVFK